MFRLVSFNEGIIIPLFFERKESNDIVYYSHYFEIRFESLPLSILTWVSP